MFEEKPEPTELDENQKKPRQHVRAGFTTHKGQGTSKARRQMAAKSRRINRRK